ncbi:lactate racemase domain-containing protein, partial [Candidatus Poribacteria bacterium]
LRPEEAFESALNNPVGGESLEDLVARKKVCVTIEDYSRREPHKEIVSALSARLSKARMVQYIVVTGTHNPTDERNLKIKSMMEDVASDLGLDFDVDINVSREAERFDYIGTTTRGTEVRTNKKALDTDIFITGSFMKPHYFAGYSAANKHFLPGMCAFDTVRVNHCGLIKDENSNYGRHPWHGNKGRRNNPLASDMLEAMSLIVQDRPVYTLAAINEGDYILWAEFGPIETVTREGIKRADEIYSFTVDPVRHLVASPGGSPYDEYLYTGIRAMELTLEAVQQGGEVLWLSECADGIHTGATQQVVEDFYDAMKSDLSTLSERLDHPDVKFHTYKAYRFKRLFEKISIYGYSSLSNEILESVNIKPVDDPQTVIDAWLENDPDDRILFVDKANRLAVYGR